MEYRFPDAPNSPKTRMINGVLLLQIYKPLVHDLPRASIYPLFWLHVVQSGPRIPSIQMGVHVCWALFPTKFIPFPADAEIFLNNPVVLFEPMAAIPFQPSHVKILTRCPRKVENDAAV